MLKAPMDKADSMQDGQYKKRDRNSNKNNNRK